MTPKPAGGQVPQVSVVIPALNARTTLDDQLNCLLEQVDPPPFEVIISDNGSSDGTQRLVADWSKRLQVRLVDSSGRRGAGYARNIGALSARADKIVFCDADDFVSRTWLTTMTERLEPRTITAGPVMRITKATPPFTPPDGRIPLANSDVDYKYMNFLPCVLSGSLGVHREDFLELGGFDNSFGRGCEDVDFSWRAQLAGLAVRIAHGCVTYYRPRRGAAAVFAAERGYTRTSVLLWVRFREQPSITGMSFRWTAKELLRTALSLRAGVLFDEAARAAWAAKMGAQLGSMEGHIMYRLLGRVPPRETLNS